MKNSNHYLLQTDEQLLESLSLILKEKNIENFADIKKELMKKKLTTLSQIWDYVKSPECSDDLAVCIEVLCKRIKSLNSSKLETFCSSSQVGYYLTNKLCGQEQEKLYAIFLDTKNRVIAEKLIFQGTLNKAIVHPRDIFRWALIYNCASFFIVHNHPSGDQTPSHQDLQITKKIKKASEYMGIDFMDHFIVSDNDYTSFRESNLL